MWKNAHEVMLPTSARVLITGASGFLGRALSRRLRADGFTVTALSRNAPVALGESWVKVGQYEDADSLLKGQDCVLHLAARVHVMADEDGDSLAVYRAANVDLTVHLAQKAAQEGVKRFVFISSVKVHGEESSADRPFSAADPLEPKDPYGISKSEAEQALRLIAKHTGMEVVIIRPPLVYGPGVGANFGSLLRAVVRGLPLPLGAIYNRRSLVGLDNLVDLIVTCATHPKAAGQAFLVSDDEDLSTPDLIRRIAAATGRPVRLFSVHIVLLSLLGKLFGRSAAVKRLCGNLQVDIANTKAVLGWKPPLDVNEGLRRSTLQWRKQ